MTRPALLDIVVLVHDAPEWADLCIRAVEHHTKNPYRLILVDNASEKEETRRMLADAERRGHTVVRLSENKSFSNGCNAGAQVGTAPYLCFLNDDAIVTEGWDGALMQDASEKYTGLVGARSNFASGAQMDPSWPQMMEPPFLVFVCVCLRRKVWETIGPMDETTFDGFSCEDLDYSWRVKKAGLHLKVSNAYVLHAGSRTLAQKVGDQAQRARNDAKYQARLVEKWGKEHVIQKTKMKQRVLVTSYHAEEHTRVAFMKQLQELRNSHGYEYSYLQISRFPIHMARTVAADYALDQGYDQWVQLDDDATFPPDIVRRLLAHEKDCVTTLAYQRKPPHLPCIFELGEDGLMGRPCEGWEDTGLRKVDVSGFHCSIMRTSVIQRLREGTKDTEGKVLVPGTRAYFGGFDKLGEDFAMCINMKKIGIQVYCDTDIDIGHMGSEINVNREYKRAFLQTQGVR